MYKTRSIPTLRFFCSLSIPPSAIKAWSWLPPAQRTVEDRRKNIVLSYRTSCLVCLNSNIAVSLRLSSTLISCSATSPTSFSSHFHLDTPFIGELFSFPVRNPPEVHKIWHRAVGQVCGFDIFTIDNRPVSFFLTKSWRLSCAKQGRVFLSSFSSRLLQLCFFFPSGSGRNDERPYDS